MTSERPVELASAAPRTTSGEETVHDGDTQKKPRFATTTARRIPLEFSTSEEIWYRLTRPRRLPRIPRPPVRKMATFAVGLIPEWAKTAHAVQLIRQHPGVTAWAGIFVGVIVVVSSYYIRTPDLYDQRYQRWMRLRGTNAVQAALAEIGPGIPEPRIQAVPTDAIILGWYDGSTHTVAFTTNRELSDLDVLEIAAHESVHAIFKEEGLQPNSKTHRDFFRLVNETTAFVLGAYIAGDAWSKQGNDGRSLSAFLVQRHRNFCDPDLPYSTYNYYLAPGRPTSHDFDRYEWWVMLTHYGPTQLVDAVDLICCQNPDPTEAARAVAKRFMRTDLAPRDRAIFEEFQRTAGRWDEEH